MWRVRIGSVVPGRPAASTIQADGRTYIRIGRKLVSASRVAWCHVYGEWPALDVEHRNLDPSDNRLDNLRLATPSQNAANTAVRKNNRLGVKGVCQVGRKFVAQICVANKRRVIGRFASLHEASAAYQHAAREAFGEYARED